MQTQPQQSIGYCEKAIVTFIHGYLAQNQCAPTFREIAEGVGLAVSPTRRWLEKLRDKGWLRWEPKPRSFQLWFQFQRQEEHEQENLA